jgi:hypothetical protein
MATFNIYDSFTGTKVVQKYCALCKIHFLRKFVTSLGKHNKIDLFGLSDKAADGIFTISVFKNISQTFSHCHWDHLCADLDNIAVAFVVHQA